METSNRSGTMPCLACGGATRFVAHRRSRDYDQSRLYRIFRCQDCASFSAESPYTTDIYDKDYYLIAEDPYIHDPQMYHYAKVLAKLNRGNPSVKSLLDVGCGSGKFLRTYSQRDPSARLHGLEINPDSVEKVRSSFPEYTIFGSYSELGDTLFDVVCAWNVIEHVPKPAEFVAQLEKHTRLGGWVALSTPNYIQINRWVDGIGKWEAIDPPHHLCILSHQALKERFRQCGLSIIHFSTFSWHFGGYYNPPRWWKPKYLLPFVLGKLRLGGNLLMVARKA